MKPFRPNVPQDIQAFLVANFSQYGRDLIAKDNSYREIHNILHCFINWSFSSDRLGVSRRTDSDNKAFHDAYDFFENGELDKGYEVLRNSDVQTNILETCRCSL